ncbi:MAG: rhomboid family intramembrane serine protease [Paracoccaceae bacterium]|nr:rhomboid family intramembrane serine protease [Paracoccaceae bacterium]
MFPIRDHNPSNRTPYVTWALIAANVLVFLSYLPMFSDPRALNAVYMTWGLVPAQLTEAPITILTSMFLHGGIMHLIGNMLFLWVFGDNLEDEMGHGPFLLFYIAGGVGAALAQVAADPFSFVPMVGASGAVAAVMGGYILLFPRARVDILVILIVIIRIIPLPAGIVLGLWFALQLFSGSVTDTAGGGVAYWAHAGGFLAGLAMTVPLWLRLGGPGFWRRTDGHPPHPEARYRMVRSSVPRAGRRR